MFELDLFGIMYAFVALSVNLSARFEYQALYVTDS